jgi:hypothetical protein
MPSPRRSGSWRRWPPRTGCVAHVCVGVRARVYWGEEKEGLRLGRHVDACGRGARASRASCKCTPPSWPTRRRHRMCAAAWRCRSRTCSRPKYARAHVRSPGRALTQVPALAVRTERGAAGLDRPKVGVAHAGRAGHHPRAGARAPTVNRRHQLTVVGVGTRRHCAPWALRTSKSAAPLRRCVCVWVWVRMFVSCVRASAYARIVHICMHAVCACWWAAH